MEGKPSSERLALVGHGDTTISMLQTALTLNDADGFEFAAVSRLHPLDTHLVLRVPSSAYARQSLLLLRGELEKLARVVA